MSRWQEKYDALATAHSQRYGIDLPRDGVILGLGPAQLETRCGDAWPGPDGLVGTDDDERNWGACTLRSLNAAEAKCLRDAKISPTIAKNHVEVEKAAMAALAVAGLPRASGTLAGINVPSATLHCDSRTVKDPTTGKAVTIPHFAWFANFATHVDGAAYYLHLLGQSGRDVLKRSGSAHELATAMYNRGYYGGFKPHSSYTAKDGTVHDGNAENIAAYEANINYWLPAIRAALNGGPSHPTLRRGAHGEDVKRLQRLLNAKDGHATLLDVDGGFGALTEEAVREFQTAHQLSVDGVVGPATWTILEK